MVNWSPEGLGVATFLDSVTCYSKTIFYRVLHIFLVATCLVLCKVILSLIQNVLCKVSACNKLVYYVFTHWVIFGLQKLTISTFKA